MELSALAGNAQTKEQLSQQASGRGLSHAYLISGPRGSGRHTLARILAGAMVCSRGEALGPCGVCNPCKKVVGGIHPDVAVICGPGEDKPITVDQVRALRSDAHIRPNDGERKLYLLDGVDRMNASAQNAMLKLLEEGPHYAAFVLLAENAGAVLETVRSRCEGISLLPVPLGACLRWLETAFPQQPQQLREEAAIHCQGILARAVEQLQGDGQESAARLALAQALAQAMELGGEGELFEQSMALEKYPKQHLPLLLDALQEQLSRRMVESGNRQRLFRGVELVGQLRRAVELNVNSGQLAGWLCAGMFGEG